MARPQFTDLSPADERELNSPAPRQAAPPPVAPLLETPPPPAPPVVAIDPEEVTPPVNVQRQPPDSPPLNSLAKDAAASKDITSLEDAFDKADKDAALESAKTPEQKEAERVAAEASAHVAEAPMPPVVAEAPVTTAQTDQTIKDVESELANPNLKARDRKRYKELLTSLKAEKTARTEYETRLRELQAKPVPTAVDTAELTKLREEQGKLADENLKYRRILSLQDDAEVTKRFEEPVKKAEEGIASVLKTYNLGQGTLDLIQKEGGFAAFSKSGKLLALTVEQDDPDNPGQKKTVRIQKSASDITREWLNNMAPADAEVIREGMREQISANKARTAFFEQEGAKAKEYFESQRTAAAAQTTEQAEAAKKISAEYEKWVGETEGKVDWLKEQPIAADAAPEAKKTAEAHNAFVKETKAFLRSSPKTVEEYQKLVYDAAEARHLRRTQPTQQARIKELEAQVARLQGASPTTPRRGSILPGGDGAPAAPKVKKFDPMRDDPTDRLAAEFAALGQ